MTEQEYQKLVERIERWWTKKESDPEAYAICEKWWNRHNATYFAFSYYRVTTALPRKVFPLLFSGKSDEEILKELDKIAPPGKTYL